MNCAAPGPNGLLGEPTNNDDVLVPLTVAYNSATNTATLTFSGLQPDVYRLTVKDNITGAGGVALDGDGNGTPTGNYVRDFVVGGPTTTLPSPNFTLDPTTSGFGAGQLVQGTSNAFDGLNRLQVGGSDYDPVGGSLAGADVVAQQTMSQIGTTFVGGSTFTLADGGIASPGLSTTFTVADAAEVYHATPP